MRNKTRRFLGVLGAGLWGIVLIAMMASRPVVSAPPATALAVATLGQPVGVEVAEVEGHDKCVDCHKQEVRAWLASKHATRAFDLLRTAPSSLEYADKLGIDHDDIARTSMCVQCHATPRIDDVTSLPTVIAGVSCEACHNPSGGDTGWLNPHASYGSRGTRRDEESDAHYAERQTRCHDAGQLASSNLYGLVKRCFECHVVSDEKLAEAGHDHGDGFEFAGKVLGEVRHNFFLDAESNAKVATLWTDPLHHGEGRDAAGRIRVMFLVGQLVDLEVSFRGLAGATDETDFTDVMIDRIEEAYGLLAEDLLEELEETELPEVESLVDEIEDAIEQLDDDGFDPEQKQQYTQTADRVAEAASQFARRDGSQLSEIDELELLPEGPFEGVFQP